MALEFTTDEGISRFEYCLDGQDNVLILGNTTLSGLTSGAHNVTVYGYDALGYLGSSKTIYFNVEPSPTYLIPISIVALTAAISFGLVAYFLKFKRKKL